MRAALWLALCAGCLYQSCFALLPLLISSEGRSPYAERRIRNGFGGLRLDQLESALDHRLPREQAVALGPELAGSNFLRQRFTEGLFPRLVDPGSPFVLGKAGDPLVTLAPGNELFIAGPAATAPTPVIEPSEADQNAITTIARVLATMLAFGALGWWFIPVPAEGLLAGAALAGTAQTVATLLQFPLLPILFPLMGLIALALLFARGRAQPLARPRNDTLAFLALLFAISLVPLFFPSLKWDSRSIWLFHAKTIFFHGFIPRALAVSAAYSWAHFDYPPLFSAWMSAFSSGDSFSERAAQTALAALAGALCFSLWRLARERFGRREGGLLALAVTLGVSPLVTGGLADGALLLTLLVARLALQKSEARLGAVALLAASLMKTEGLLLGAFVIVLTAPRSRAWLAFLPALALIAWAKLTGVPSDADGILWAQLAGIAMARLGTVLGAAAKFGAGSFFLAGGFASLLYAIARAPRAPATLLAVLALLFGLAVFLITPLELGWHLNTAMERLLFHGAGFALLAFAETSLAGRRTA